MDSLCVKSSSRKGGLPWGLGDLGKCWKEIVETANEENVDLIVMTERGSGEEKVFGSCAERVVKHANKPVLIVR